MCESFKINVYFDEKGEELFVYNERFKDNYGLKN